MAGFDPKAYLSQKDEPPPAAKGFDPKAYAADQQPKDKGSLLRFGAGMVANALAPGAGEFVMTPRDKDVYVRGAAQGATVGLADEATAGVGALWDVTQAALGKRGDISLGDAYRTRRDVIRKADAEAAKEAPGLFGAGTVAGGVMGGLTPGMGALNGAKAATKAGGAVASTLGSTGGAMVRRFGKEAIGRGAIAAGQGAAFGAGTSEADLTKGEVGGFAKDVATGGALGGGLQVGLSAAAPYAKQGLAWGAKKVGSALGGVAEKNINAYLANPQAVREAPTLGAIKDQVDTEVAGPLVTAQQAKARAAQAEHNIGRLDKQITEAFDSTRDKIKGEVGDAKSALERAWEAKQDELRGKAVPVAYAKEIGQRLDGELAVLGGMSQKADAALDRVAATFRKSDLLTFIDEIGGSVGVGPNRAVVGDASTAAVARLHELRQRVAGGLPDDLSAADIRAVMRDIRNDINFDRASGATNDTLTGLRKKVTGGMSDMLKEQSPEYAQIMGEMAPRAKAVESMSEHFGTPDKALASLETLAGGKGARATYLRDVIDEYVGATGHTDVLDKLKDIAAARQVLSSRVETSKLRASLPETRQLERAQTALGQFDPKKTRGATNLMIEVSPANVDLTRARDDLSNALQEAQAYRGWSPGTTENRLKSVMSGRSIENHKTIDALSAATGLDFSEMLKNRAVADAFDKGYMHGSRNVNLWSLIGAVFGGSALGGGQGERVMKAGGGAFGGLIDRAGPKMTQKALDAFMAVRDSPYAPILEAAAAKGKESLARTHMILMQNNADYRAFFGGDDRNNAIQRRLQGGN